MRWLVRDAAPHDSLFFHCKVRLMYDVYFSHYLLSDSGHGGQTKDLDGDEDDGYDEGCSIFVKNDQIQQALMVFYSDLSCRLLAMRSG